MIRLAAAAEADYDEILRWTAGRFGAGQAARYGALVAAALPGPEAGLGIVGARPRADIVSGLVTLHLGRRGRRVKLFV
jgi:toxin ParE1/3/4